MAFDGSDVAALLDKAKAAYHKAERGRDPSRAEIFDTRIAQAKAVIEESTHHINNTLEG